MSGIEERLTELPSASGVYIMKGADGEVLYIGKAKNLRMRVRSYFRKTGDTRYAVRFLSLKAADIDYIVTANEKEAYLLEDTLLKRHRPRYNISLKDSKTYVSIKITVNEKFPRITMTRQIKKDGGRYFGPYISSRDVRETIKFIRRIFPLCTCSPSVFKNRARPCLDYQLGICSSPATGHIGDAAYRELVDGAIMFLEGRNAELKKILRAKMTEEAAALNFESAAKIRDRISAIDRMLEGQRVVSQRRAERDVFAFAKETGGVVIQKLDIREGRLVRSDGFVFRDSPLPDEEVFYSFITQYYQGDRPVPDEVLLPFRLDDSASIAGWLSGRLGRKVTLRVPARGAGLKLMNLAKANALETLRNRKKTKESKIAVMEELKKRLRLGRLPQRMEAFDISNIGGKDAVGAMVSFVDGEPDKKNYRLYRIRSMDTPDDYAMMSEVLTRRYSTAPSGEKTAPPPDLVLIDGGKGHLALAVDVINKRLGIAGVDLAALAKDRPVNSPDKRPESTGERVFRPNVKDPILLRAGSAADLLLRRVRDEAHRFAITCHRKLRSRGIGSLLDNIPGVGPKKRGALLERFNDIYGISAADITEIIKVPGITRDIAAEIKEMLRGI